LATETVIAKEINLLRGMGYLFGVLSYLQDEPLCSRCDLFVMGVEVSKKYFLALERSVNKNRDLPEEMRRLLLNIYAVFAELKIPDNSVRQKDAGNCRLSSGFCFAKSALTFYEKMEKTIYKEEESRING
jgi:hypothetical protein